MKIYAPNKQYSNISASVTFKNGVGETDNPRLIEWFREHGYIVEEKPEPEHCISVDTDGAKIQKADGDVIAFPNALSLDDIDKTDADQLRAYAEQEGIELGMSTSARGILQKIVSAKKQEV